jgi:CheY-like chemotaxis protein
MPLWEKLKNEYKQILIIDDDEDDQDIFITAMQKVSPAVSCLAYSNAKEALHQLTEKAISPDVIFLDLNMPVMTGQQFLLEARKVRALAAIPIIVFSTTSHKPTIQLTRDLGANGFITKPDKFDELITVLKSFIIAA